MPIRALFFDLDDTLLETHTAHQAALRICCERAASQHPNWTPEALHAAFHAAHHAMDARMEAGEVEFVSQIPFRIRTWDDTLRSCGLTPDLAEELASRYIAERRMRYRLFADVEAALDALSKEYRLVLVTNGISDLQREKCVVVELARWFDHILVSGEVRSWKPDAGIFRRALELAEVGPEEALMVGDNLERDVAGAAAVGIGTVWMRRYEHLQPIAGITPDLVVADLPELARRLTDWTPASA
jgi:putative hydrolase of the HAD superfamily